MGSILIGRNEAKVGKVLKIKCVLVCKEKEGESERKKIAITLNEMNFKCKTNSFIMALHVKQLLHFKVVCFSPTAISSASFLFALRLH